MKIMISSASSTSSTPSTTQTQPADAFLPLLEVGSLPPFNPKEDLNTVAILCKLWKRSFNLYLVAKGRTKDEQKTTLLLHTGGLNLLGELYYMLAPGRDIISLAESMVLQHGYFSPQLNVPFERHQFGQMEQTSGVSVD